eukprot:GHUV01041793.1.p2 GENE.GHUV01041793.1~~GHUV01041793.1.p2  ORF type:complete len:152 (-),score=11.93 GHUV01041793.1:113-568(-)
MPRQLLAWWQSWQTWGGYQRSACCDACCVSTMQLAQDDTILTCHVIIFLCIHSLVDSVHIGVCVVPRATFSSIQTGQDSCTKNQCVLPCCPISRLSRVVKQHKTHRTTNTVGTMSHMPPELLRYGRMSAAVDLFAFGVMMWELFTGQVAFR